jgi:hypothetical protein
MPDSIAEYLGRVCSAAASRAGILQGIGNLRPGMNVEGMMLFKLALGTTC